MSPAAHLSLVLASALIGLLLAAVALWGSWNAWRKHRNPIDLTLAIAAVTWLAHLVVSTTAEFAGSSRQSAYVTDAGFQVLIISISSFLLTSCEATPSCRSCAMRRRSPATAVAVTSI